MEQQNRANDVAFRQTDIQTDRRSNRKTDPQKYRCVITGCRPSSHLTVPVAVIFCQFAVITGVVVDVDERRLVNAGVLTTCQDGLARRITIHADAESADRDFEI